MKSPAEFDGAVSAIEIYARKGDEVRVRRGLAELGLGYRGLSERAAELAAENARLREVGARLKSSLETAAEDYRTIFATFEKFRGILDIVQRMRAFYELPGMLAQVREALDVDGLQLVLAAEDYAEFVPPSMSLLPSSALAAELARHFPSGIPAASGDAGPGESPGAAEGMVCRMGRLSDAPSRALLLPPEVPEGYERHADGSYFLAALRDKYDPSRIIGSLGLFDHDTGRYARGKATDFLGHFCDMLAVTLVSVRDREKLDRENVVDPLTRCHNRAYLQRHAPRLLSLAERRELPVCLLFMDLNGFKPINDSLGHETGDKVLIEVGTRLKQLVRRHDILCRLGGDEFVLLLPGATPAGAREVIRRMGAILAGIDVGALAGRPTDLRVSASVGVARYTRGQGLAGLLEAADQAMYEVKRAGKSQR